jgi:hypothetical protein
MDDRAVSPNHVAGWARELAWIIVVGSGVAAVAGFVAVIRGAQALPFPWYVLVLLAVRNGLGSAAVLDRRDSGSSTEMLVGTGSHHWQ